jgi:hypothetical protein
LNAQNIADFTAAVRRAAERFLPLARQGRLPVTLVHHNDADGMAAAAALAYALGRLDVDFRLQPVEKVHAPILEKIHAPGGDIVLYADLGGQSCHLIGGYATGNPLVIILDHHLPGGAVPGHVIHLNPELFGISGDTDASGAAVGACFARALAGGCSPPASGPSDLPALLGVLGAIGDGQMPAGALSGLNRMLLEAALAAGDLQASPGGFTIPRLGHRTAREVVDLLDLLGSVGFYAGHAATGVNFLLGKDAGEAQRVTEGLADLKASAFRREEETVRRQGLGGSRHFQWVDVKDRFKPMGVKAIGLFLEDLGARGLATADRYLIGFQHLPAEMPGLGRLDQALTKISARVPPALKAAIQQGGLPDFMTLIPGAAARVQGSADGCHRFAAAALIAQGREGDFLEALEQVLAQAG